MRPPRPPSRPPRWPLVLVVWALVAAGACEPSPDEPEDAGLPASDLGPSDAELPADTTPDVAVVPDPDGGGEPLKGFEEPAGWHHRWGSSRNTCARPASLSPATLRPAWEDAAGARGPSLTGCGLAGLAVGQAQGSLTTAPRPLGAELLALSPADGSLRWRFDLGPLAALGAPLADPDGRIFVADADALYALRAAPSGPPTVLWKEPHDAWSPWLGFAPQGHLVEVIATGGVRIHDRQRGLRAEAALPLDRSLPLPPGLGLPLGLQWSVALAERARAAGATCEASEDRAAGEGFLVPAHLRHLRTALAAPSLLDAPPQVVQASLGRGIGPGRVTGGAAATALSATRGGPPSESLARVFVPTLGAYHPPHSAERSVELQAFDDELLTQLFLGKLGPEQHGAALARLRTAGPDAAGRYARDPDPGHRCPLRGDEPPHLLPMLGAPSGKPPQRPDTLPASTDAERDAAWLRILEMRADFLRLSRGWYTGLLWPVDWDPSRNTLTVGEPLPLPAPAVGPPVVVSGAARSDGVPVLFVPLPDRILAYEVGVHGEPPRGPLWTWAAGVGIGRSLLGLTPEEFGHPPGSGAGVGVSAGPRGFVIVQDRSATPGKPPEDAGCSSDLCRVVYTLSPLPFDESAEPQQASRVQRFRAGATVELAWPVAAPAAGQKYGYLAFGRGPVAADPLRDPLAEIFGAQAVGSSRLCVLSLRAAHLLQCLPLDEAPSGSAALTGTGGVVLRHAGLDAAVAYLLAPEGRSPPACGLRGVSDAD